jgi:two-component system LytT family response regulator
LTSLVKTQGKPSRITLYHSKGFRIVDPKDIVRLEADGNCTMIFFADGNKYLDTKTLKTFEETLDEDKFFRVHKSHLINLDHLREYLNSDGGQVVMKDGTLVPVARGRLAEFLAKIKS